MMNKTVFLLCSVKPTLLLIIHKFCFVFLDKIRFFKVCIFQDILVCGNVVSVKQPAQKPLEPKTVSVRQED